MAREINRLTDAQIRNAQPREKDYPLPDGDGLDILITTKATETGGKYWRLHFRFGGKQDTLRLGVYPAVSLSAARKMKLEAKAKIAAGVNPRAAAKKQKATASDATLFQTIALEWMDKEIIPTRAPTHVAKNQGRLRNYAFPALGDTPIDAINPRQLDALRQSILARGERQKDQHPDGLLDTAQRVIGIVSQVWNYAKRKGVIPLEAVNPALALRGSWPTKITRHYPTIRDPDKIGDLLLAIDRYPGDIVTVCALKLAPLFFLRPGELRTLEWKHVDFDAATIRLPIDIMKALRVEKEARSGETAHIVPLARQALDILHQLHQATGPGPGREGRYLFAGRGKAGHMSANTVNKALKTMGFDGERQDKIRGHGFRHMASSILHGQDYGNHPFIEKQLAHKEPDGRISATYNHAESGPTPPVDAGVGRLAGRTPRRSPAARGGTGPGRLRPQADAPAGQAPALRAHLWRARPQAGMMQPQPQTTEEHPC